MINWLWGERLVTWGDCDQCSLKKRWKLPNGQQEIETEVKTGKNWWIATLKFYSVTSQSIPLSPEMIQNWNTLNEIIK